MATEEHTDLQAVAVAIPRAAAKKQDLSDIWSRLIRHQLEVAHTFATDQSEYMVLREKIQDPPPLSGRNLAIFETVFVGVGRKVVSYDVGLASSSLAQVLKSALRDMGLNCSPARAPSLLVKLAHAARSPASQLELKTGQFALTTNRYLVVSDDLECPLLKQLAPAQRAVMRLLIYGSSHADIAARRHTSSRTVANQVASACQRLGVSGRFDLLQRVATARRPMNY